MISRLYQYSLLMRLDRPIGILLLLWPTLWALWAASEGNPDILVLVVFVLGVIIMRSAGCVINDYADRDIDRHVCRTQFRPLATGQITQQEALLVFGALCALAFGLVLQLNTYTILLSLVGVTLAAIYPFMKRYTHLPQVVLGMAFGWSVPMAYVATTASLPRNAWLLFIATVLWTTAYDTMYAMVDRSDDVKIGVKSTAILFGEADKTIIGLLQITMISVMVLIGIQMEWGLAYYLGLSVAAGLAIYQQYLIKNREPADCFRAFLNNNWFGAVIFAGIFAEYGLRG